MKRSPDERLTVRVAREVCQRIGAKAQIAGSIAKLGSSYVVALDAQECAVGESLALEQEQAAGQEAVLGALGDAARRLRGRLGESLASVAKLDVPIEQATTGSLEALKAYSLANQERSRGNTEAAIRSFRRAIELDPDFAVAHGELGTTLGNRGELRAQHEHYRRAFELRDRVSELERLYISAHYYNSVTGEVDKAQAVYERWKKTYPRDWTPVNNLSVQYLRSGDLNAALDEALAALALEPDHVLPYANVAASYFFMGRFDEMRAIVARAHGRGLDSSTLRLFLFWAGVCDGAGDERGAQLAAEGHSAEHRLLGAAAVEAWSHGRLEDSRTLGERASRLAREAGNPETGHRWTLDLAAGHALVGRAREARTLIASVEADDGGEESLRLALARALVGDRDGASQLGDELSQAAPHDSYL